MPGDAAAWERVSKGHHVSVFGCSNAVAEAAPHGRRAAQLWTGTDRQLMGGSTWVGLNDLALTLY